MSENTITIPADLWGRFHSAAEMRRYATYVREPDGGVPHTTAATVLELIADEIERQAPRPEGWYHVKDDGGERVLWWYGTGWSYYADRGDKTDADDDATITPVTIGGAS